MIESNLSRAGMRHQPPELSGPAAYEPHALPVGSVQRPDVPPSPTKHRAGVMHEGPSAVSHGSGLRLGPRRSGAFGPLRGGVADQKSPPSRAPKAQRCGEELHAEGVDVDHRRKFVRVSCQRFWPRRRRCSSCPAPIDRLTSARSVRKVVRGSVPRSGALWELEVAADRGDCAEQPMLSLPVQFLIATIAAAINDRMAQRLEYAQEEVRTLKEALTTATGKERIRFTEAQRRRLALMGEALTARERETCCQIVRPETILAWLRRLVAAKYDSSNVRGTGRPRKSSDVRRLVVKLAQENPRWGYTKIRDALRGLGIGIGRTAIADILVEAGIEPAPERRKRRTWKAFIRSHIETLYACDFFARRGAERVRGGQTPCVHRHRAQVAGGRGRGSGGQSQWEVDGAGGAGASGSRGRISSESDAHHP